MKYISMLRGINVSGQKKIKMADLAELYKAQGYKNVTTYIQSGNVIFESTVKNKEKLQESIARAITAKYKFQVPVDVRTHKEFKEIVEQCPFAEAKIAENGSKVLVTFLQAVPSKDNRKQLQEHVTLPEKLVHRDNAVYIFCPNGYGKSKLTNSFLEKKLAVIATTRNWKSVVKLHELSM